MGSEWGGGRGVTQHPESLCTARCHCGRRCCKAPKHLLKHRCLKHGKF